jgi:hypothetical protein
MAYYMHVLQRTTVKVQYKVISEIVMKQIIIINAFLSLYSIT